MSVQLLSRAKSGLVRSVTWVLMLLVAVAATLGIASVAHADGNEELAGQLSFYSLASTTATFFSNSLEPEAADRPEMWDAITQSPANGGSMLGYSDKNRNNGSNWVQSMLTAASHTMSFSAFEHDTGEDTGEGSREILSEGSLGYAQFGATLNGLGLDSMKSGMGLNLGGLIGGGILWLLFQVSSGVSSLFAGTISLLKTLNPFLLFHAGVQAVSPEFAAGMVQESHPGYEGLPAGFRAVSDFIGEIYGFLNTMAWEAMLPIFFGVLVLGVMLRGSKFATQGGGLKKFGIRLAFLGLGLPLRMLLIRAKAWGCSRRRPGKSKRRVPEVVATAIELWPCIMPMCVRYWYSQTLLVTSSVRRITLGLSSSWYESYQAARSTSTNGGSASSARPDSPVDAHTSQQNPRPNSLLGLPMFHVLAPTSLWKSPARTTLSMPNVPGGEATRPRQIPLGNRCVRDSQMRVRTAVDLRLGPASGDGDVIRRSPPAPGHRDRSLGSWIRNSPMVWSSLKDCPAPTSIFSTCPRDDDSQNPPPVAYGVSLRNARGVPAWTSCPSSTSHP